MSYTKVTKESFVSGGQWRQTRTVGTGSPVPWDSATDWATVSLQTTKSGVANPLWRSQVGSGSSAGTGYSLSGFRVDTHRSGNVSIVYSFGSGTGKVTMTDSFLGFNFPVSNPPSYIATFTAPDATALAQVYRKIDQQATQWQGLSFFAEFSDVVRQFGHPFKSIVGLTHRHLNRLESSKRGLTGSVDVRREKMSKIVADTYLEYAFGLAPLISDAKKAAEALARYELLGNPDLNPVLRTRVVGRGSSTITANPSFSKVLAYNSKIYGNVITEQSSEARVQYIVGLRTAPVVDYNSNKKLIELCGFTPAKFVPALWEAVPWSWLIDYFSNVGDVLFSVGVDTSSVSWINKTTIMIDLLHTKSQLDAISSRALTTAYGYTSFQSTGTEMGEWKVRRTTLTRTIPSTLGWPSLVWSLPFGDEHLDSKLAALSAVLVQRKSSSLVF